MQIFIPFLILFLIYVTFYTFLISTFEGISLYNALFTDSLHYLTERFFFVFLCLSSAFIIKKLFDKIEIKNKRYKNLFDNLYIGIAIYRTEDGKTFKFIEYNKFGSELDKVPIKKVLGKEITEVFPGVREYGLLDVLKQVYETGIPKMLPSKLYEDDVLKTYRENFVFKLSDNEIVACYYDDTEKKKTEEALIESERKKKLLLDMFPDMIVLIDKNKNVIWANRTTLEKFPDIINKNYREIFLKDFTNDICPISDTIDSKRIEKLTIDLKDQVFEIISIPLFENGNDVIEFIYIIRDISEKMLIEKREREMNIRLEKSKRMDAIGQLAGGVAHNFNNLLMGILGYISLFQTEEEICKKFGDQLLLIERQIAKAANLTKQLLGFARGGKYDVRILSLNKIVENACDIFSITKKEVSIIKDLSPNLKPIRADRDQIDQVLLNLLLNSQQAMGGSSGEIFVKTENVFLKNSFVSKYSKEPGEYVKLIFKDTGHGIDPTIIDRIFEPFFTTREETGTGLGLASVYGIVESHHGIIVVESKMGQGTEFQIYFPANDENINDDELQFKTSAKIEGSGELVLLIDDEDFARKASVGMLEGLNYKVIEAVNGIEAIEIYEKRKDEIDLIILDLIMPIMSGNDIFTELKRINPDSIIILASGYSLNGDAIHLMERGCNGFLQKPFGLVELSSTIYRVLSKFKR